MVVIGIVTLRFGAWLSSATATGVELVGKVEAAVA